jgi:hypothetical protein
VHRARVRAREFGREEKRVVRILITIPASG